eukprot:5229961-Pleurochrysis_carterae.AAC.1
MGEPRTPQRLAYMMHDEIMRDRAAELEVTARRDTRALVSLQEMAVFSALAGFEGRGDKSSITHTYQTPTTFMRLPSATGRGVLGEGRSKFTYEASPAAVPGQCPVHFRATAHLRVGTASIVSFGTHYALRWQCNCTWHTCSLIMAYYHTCP